MRLAVINHSAVLQVNQTVYAALAQAHPELDLRLIVPARWHTSLAGAEWFSAAAQGPFVRALPVHLPGKLHLHWYGRGLRRLLEEFRPDVLLVIEEPYSLAAAQAARLARRLGARLVIYTNQNLLRRYPPPFSWMRAFVLCQADLMLAPTEACVEVLRGLGYRGPASLFPYPFTVPEPDLPLPSGRGAPSDGCPQPESRGGVGPVVGYLGRLDPQKGLLDLLEAACLLHERGRHFQLLLVGDGPLRAELEAYAAAHFPPGQVKFTGYVPHDQVAPYFRALDLLVLPSRTTPSWKEQFGRVLLEAWGYGVPVVGSDSGHIPVLIRQTGGGLVFHEGDAADLEAKLEELLADPPRARRMADAAREVVKQEYSVEGVGERLWEDLQNLARRP